MPIGDKAPRGDEPYRDTRVLVTGARGFLGAHLVRRLTNAGATVYGVSRSAMEDGPPIHWCRSDLRHPRSVRRLLDHAQPAVIFHLAGHVTGDPGLGHVLPTFHSLLSTTVSLLVGAASRGVDRLVLVGSTTEIGPEQAETVPGSPYAAAKGAASMYGRMFHTLYGSPVVVVRPAMTYGPGQPAHRLVPTVIRALLKGVPPELSSGNLAADWTYVDDVVEGLFRAGRRSGIDGATFDLGCGELHSVKDVVGRLVDIVRDIAGPCPSPVFGALPDRPHEQVRAANTAHTKRVLGWSARTPLVDGLRLTVEWQVRQQGGRMRA